MWNNSSLFNKATFLFFLNFPLLTLSLSLLCLIFFNFILSLNRYPFQKNHIKKKKKFFPIFCASTTREKISNRVIKLSLSMFYWIWSQLKTDCNECPQCSCVIDRPYRKNWETQEFLKNSIQEESTSLESVVPLLVVPFCFSLSFNSFFFLFFLRKKGREPLPFLIVKGWQHFSIDDRAIWEKSCRLSSRFSLKVIRLSYY